MNIQLTNSTKLTALIDDEDYRLVEGLRFRCLPDVNTHYAAATNGPRILLHRIILWNDFIGNWDLETHHINENGLDNRRCNLELVTATYNQLIRTRTRSDNMTGFIGVSKSYSSSFAPRNKLYSASYRVNKKSFSVGGYFDTAEEAAKARIERMQEVGLPSAVKTREGLQAWIKEYC